MLQQCCAGQCHACYCHQAGGRAPCLAGQLLAGAPPAVCCPNVKEQDGVAYGDNGRQQRGPPGGPAAGPAPPHAPVPASLHGPSESPAAVPRSLGEHAGGDFAACKAGSCMGGSSSSSEPAKAFSARPRHKQPSRPGMKGRVFRHATAPRSTRQGLLVASCHQEAATAHLQAQQAYLLGSA